MTDSDLTKLVLRDWVLDVYICSDGCIYASLNFNVNVTEEKVVTVTFLTKLR